MSGTSRLSLRRRGTGGGSSAQQEVSFSLSFMPTLSFVLTCTSIHLIKFSHRVLVLQQRLTKDVQFLTVTRSRCEVGWPMSLATRCPRPPPTLRREHTCLSLSGSLPSFVSVPASRHTLLPRALLPLCFLCFLCTDPVEWVLPDAPPWCMGWSAGARVV